MTEAVRIFGGPYDGAEVDLTVLFGERLPAGFAVPRRDATAHYERGDDADGPLYRFVGSRPYAGDSRPDRVGLVT